MASGILGLLEQSGSQKYLDPQSLKSIFIASLSEHPEAKEGGVN